MSLDHGWIEDVGLLRNVFNSTMNFNRVWLAIKDSRALVKLRKQVRSLPEAHQKKQEKVAQEP